MKFPTNRFKQAITGGQRQVGLWSTLCSNLVADVLADAGYDWIVIDMEHTPNDLAAVLGQLQAYAAGTATPVVRVPWNEPVIVKRLLDLGAFSLLFPMVQNADEAEAAVRATRYPPHGVRGVALGQRANRFGRTGDYLERVEDEICVLVQIETLTALAHVEEIAAVDGVDGVFFGPADLSADMGMIGRPGHADVCEAIRAGAATARAAGKPVGILIGDEQQAIGWLREGFEFVACGADTALLVRGADGLLARVREAVDDEPPGSTAAPLCQATAGARHWPPRSRPRDGPAGDDCMDWITQPGNLRIAGLAAALALLALLVVLRLRARRALPYARRAALLSAAERNLLAALREAGGPEVQVWARVGATDALGLRRGTRRGRARAAHRRIAGTRFDFLLCAAADTRPLVAVQRGERARDARERHLERACTSAGLALLRVPRHEAYDAEALRGELQPYLETATAPEPGGGLAGRQEPIIDLPPD
ncbi:MAG: aldolase/citrate lyase family protein [Halofilum sp. (in: g-proteobacteria)]|nr:aldolase/citrate lyase family protein [Halofilum sp. (in: g-proteobacteria)]